MIYDGLTAVDVVAVPARRLLICCGTVWCGVLCLARHNELPEDDILNVETCRNMLFVTIVYDIIVQSLVKL